MPSALDSAATVVFSLLLGKLLGYKLPKGGAHAASTKDLILTALLPATIFLSFLNLDIKPSALLWPVFALVANFVNFAAYRTALGLVLPSHLHQSLTSICLPLCSFSPGLSSFAFIIEFAGMETRGLVAFADFGNKIYGILLSKFICFALIRSGRNTCPGRSKKVAGISAGTAVMQLLSEPITIACIAGVALASFRVSVTDIGFVGTSFQKLAAATTPVLLLFIGLKLKLEPSLQTALIGLVLMMRAGINLLLAAAINAALGLDADKSLGWLLFLQSAASFWPYSSMQSMSDIEKAVGCLQRRTFNLEAALAFITLSFPFSIAMCVAICLGSSYIVPPYMSALVGAALLLPALAGAAVIGRMNVSWPGDAPPPTAALVPSTEAKGAPGNRKDAPGAAIDMCEQPGNLAEVKEDVQGKPQFEKMQTLFIAAVEAKRAPGVTTMV